MGSFKGHLLPGTLFLAVGGWNVWAAVARFAFDPAGFRLLVWNPVGGGALRHLELYMIAGGAFLDMCVEVLYSTHLHILAPGGGVNPAHLNDLEHGGVAESTRHTSTTSSMAACCSCSSSLVPSLSSLKRRGTCP